MGGAGALDLAEGGGGFGSSNGAVLVGGVAGGVGRSEVAEVGFVG